VPDRLKKRPLSATADIVAAYLAANSVTASDLPGLIRDVHRVLADLGEAPSGAGALHPPVAISQSVQPDYIVCLEDGSKRQVLTGYLRRFDLTPGEYRKKWGLPADYPMVAPNYSRKRSAYAKSIGLGRKGKPAQHPQ